ncbi:hypothetical protein [Alloprevotella sp. Lung230]|uniref:hypothetical protein n=1 Tax=Alloprevotella sp. Lung230 TaxID=2766595 RepID=UPI001655ACED|nr:hypothetical protein [Alloprevotella sp. Lung230]MBC8626323.1 hypothetical protein [Alloprevotella sp. Lung230]
MQRFLSALPIRWALLLVTGLWSILAVAQSTCPELKVSDFKVNYYAANADCGTAGQIIVTYRNNVAGFSKLTYETSTDGATWGNPVEQTSLSVPTTIPLTGWTAGQTIHLRVTGTCPSGTQEVTFPTLTHRSEQPHAVAPVFETTPAGGCSATAGSIDVSVGEVSGFTKAEYFLYQGTTLLNSITSNTPYAESTFYNLPSGTYKVVMRATPACTPASPGATFKNGAYEVEKMVKVSYFSILPTPIPTRGTACAGGVRVAVARVMGVNGLKYEVLPSGGGAALQTEQLVYPNFTHTFFNLPSGNYELRATSDCGTVETVPFTVPIGGVGTLSASTLQGTYAHCSIGKISATVPGTTAACPVDYVLTPDVGSPITKTGVTTESVVFEGLPAGNYTVSASWAAQNQSVTINVPIVSLGTLKATSTRARYSCDPTGTLKVELENGVYLEPMTLLLSINGTPIHTVSLGSTEREKILTGLAPNAYQMTLITECGERIEGEGSVPMEQPIGKLLFEHKSTDCGTTRTILFTHTLDPSDEGFRQFMNGGRYEVFVEGAMVANGMMPTSPTSTETDWQGITKGIYTLTKIPETDKEIIIRLSASCGSPVIESRIQRGSWAIIQDIRSITYEYLCSVSAAVEVSVYATTVGEEKTVTVTNTDNNTIIYNKPYGSSSISLKGLVPGNYKIDVYYDCAPNNRISKTFNIPLPPNYYPLDVRVSPPSCSAPLGTLDIRGPNPSSPNIYVIDVLNSSGDIVATYQDRRVMWSTPGLPADVYQVRISSPSEGCSQTFGPYEIKSSDFAFNPYAKKFHVKRQSPIVDDVTFALFSADCLTGPVDWKIYDMNNVELRHYVASSISEEPTFYSLPKQFYAIVTIGTAQQRVNIDYRTTSSDEITQITDRSLVAIDEYNSIAGCRKGKVTVTSHFIEKGYPQGPTKVYLINNSFQRVDSVVSTSIIEKCSFEINADNNYQKIEYHYNGKIYTQEDIFDKTSHMKMNGAIYDIYSIVFPSGPRDNPYYYGGINGIMQIWLNPVDPAPCENGKIEFFTMPLDAGLVLEYKLTHQSTGVQVTGKVTAANLPVIPNLAEGDWDVSIVAKYPCFEKEHHTVVTIRPSAFIPAIEILPSTVCYNSGGVKFTIPDNARGGIQKVSYSLTRLDAMGNPIGLPTQADVPTLGHPLKDPFEMRVSSGSYNVTATAFCSDGTQKVWNNGGSPLIVTESYQTLQAIQNPKFTVPTLSCTPRGKLGITINGGYKGPNYKDDYRVYLIETPLGPVPETLLPRTDAYKNSPYYADRTYGENLAAGNYKLRVKDYADCSTFDVPVEIPQVPDIAIPSLNSETLMSMQGCKLIANIKIDLKPISIATQRYGVPENYEVALVPTGGDRTTERWASVWSSVSEEYILNPITHSYERVPSYSYLKDTLSNIDFSSGADILIRQKGCPATMRRFHVQPKCVYDINFTDISDQCGSKRFVVVSNSGCQKYRYVLKKGATIIADKIINFTPTQKSYYDADFDMPNDCQNYGLSVTPIPPLTYSKVCDYGIQGVGCAPTRVSAEVKAMSTDCNGEKYIWNMISNNSLCDPKARFVIYEDATNNKVAESPAGVYSDKYESTYHYQLGKTYRVELYDNLGRPLLQTPHFHTVSYDLATSYKVDDIDLGYYCRTNERTVKIGIYSDSRCSPTDDVYPIQSVFGSSGSSTQRIPQILRIEARNNTTGVIYFSTQNEWNQTPSCGSQQIWGKHWQTRATDGTITEGADLTAGNYTLSVTTDCGVKTSTFKIGYKPVILDIQTTGTLQCDNRLDIMPSGRAYIEGSTETIDILGYKFEDDLTTSYPWGTGFSTYMKQRKMILTLKFPDGERCQRTWDFEGDQFFLAVDNAKSISYFCTDSNKGIISIGATGGHPPYTYTLKELNGTDLETKTSTGAVTFEHGTLGETYWIDITDDCGLVHIKQRAVLNDLVKIGYNMSTTRYFCDGETAKFGAINWEGATYDWTGPNGYSSHSREVEILTSNTTAGTYHVVVHPPTCSTTLEADIRVVVANVKEVNSGVSRTACVGEKTIVNIGSPTVLLNGQATNLHKYQWQMTTDASDPTSWRGIYGATEEQLEYVPRYTGTFYLRRVTTLDGCSDYSQVSMLTASPGLNSIVSSDELNVLIEHKNPFTLTAGILTGNPSRTYQWQRSVDKTTWSNITTNGNDVTYTEKERYAAIVYYRRITSVPGCSTESPIITVRFKKRYPAMVNPHLRQRVLTE